MLRITAIVLYLTTSVQAAMEGFIVGGAAASINEYAHSAFLTVDCYTVELKDNYWVCGASLLNQQILLTAAHCITYCVNHGTRMLINLGNEHRTHGVLRTVSGYVYHENYSEETNNCDIGMVKMRRPVMLSSVIRRVALMRSPPYKETAYVAGWGDINERTEEPGLKLSEIDQKVWDRSSCLKLFRAMPRGAICASSPQRHKFAAAGDSGSGLMVRGYIQIGLVSYKVPTIAVNVIVYTAVSYHYDWIDINARRLYCP